MLENIVRLERDVPATVHITDWEVQNRDITDPQTNRDKVVSALVMHVDELNGRPIDANLSTIADKFAATMRPFLEAGTFRDLNFTITKRGSGFGTNYEVRSEPRPPA